MSTTALPFADLLRSAEAHLTGACPKLSGLIARVGPCTLVPKPDVFQVLIGSILAQFISTAAAKSIRDRLTARLKGKVTPARLLALTDDELRACGIAGSKAKALRGLAEHFRANRGFARKLAAADDPTARAMLLPLHGVGPWTVDMVMIFSIFRPDVLPTGDFAVRAGVRDLFGLTELPKPKEMIELTEHWRPYRSVASWYLWRSRGFVPQSEPAANGEGTKKPARKKK